MTDFVALRKRMNDLIERQGRALDAATWLLDLSVEYTNVHLTSATDRLQMEGCREGYYPEDDIDRLSDMVGKPMVVFSKDFLCGVIDQAVIWRNIPSLLTSIRTHATTSATVDPNAAVPSLEGWSENEIATVVASYKGRLSSATKQLRDIHTTWKYLRGYTSSLPGFAKGACLGMFGMPDFETRHTYTEDDFKPYNTVLQTDENGVRRHVDLCPHIMSSRFWTPIIGEVMADRVEESLAIIEAVSKPREGEPDTTDYFGSHVSNSIPVEV